MNQRRFACAVALLVVFSLTINSSGQPRHWRGDDDDFRNGVPEWTNDPEFQHDVFTFVRIRYESPYTEGYRQGGYWSGGWQWRTDFPDSDLNFSYRLQQLTSLKVNLHPVVLDLTDERLFDYPFIYIIEPGGIGLTQPEVENLRKYLLGGGFLMVDDFWGEDQWNVFYRQLKEVFPDREPIDVPLDHKIFQCVYQLKERPQIPSINHALGGRGAGRTWETWDSQEVHYRAIYDDRGRMMVFICHNTDLGDGWEREGVDEWYFHEFSEKLAYPLGINIVTYAMTH